VFPWGFAAAQVPLLAAILVVAAAVKLVRPGETLPWPLPEGQGVVRPFWRLVAAIEFATAIAIVVPASQKAAMLAAAAQMALATIVTGGGHLARRRGGCGCFGAASRSTTAARSALRAAILMGGGTLGFVGLGRCCGFSAADGVALAIELTVLGMLSSEMHPALRIGWAAAERFRCGVVTTSQARALEAVRSSSLWPELSTYLPSGSGIPPILDMWREGCWTLISLPARIESRAATAVIALWLEGTAHIIRAVLLDDSSGVVQLERVVHSVGRGFVAAQPPVPGT
jgi:hypothetical protein